MTTLKAEPRNMKIKGRQLRRIGYIPAIVYGKNLEESICIQIDTAKATKLLKTNAVGSQIELIVDGNTYNTMLKDYDLHPVRYNLLHLDLQVLTEGEKVSVNAQIVLLNKDKLPDDSVLQEIVSDLGYTALPKDLIDHIDVDLTGLEIGESIRLKDLALASDERYHFHDDPMTDIVHLSIRKLIEEEPDEEETGLELSVEVPLVKKEVEE